MTSAQDEQPRDDAPVARGVYEWSTTEPSQAVVETVARADGRGQTDLPSLYEYVDPDALNTLVRTGGKNGGAVSVSFPMAGYDVTVHGRGQVAVHPPATR